jgi:hypothetical protein
MGFLAKQWNLVIFSFRLTKLNDLSSELRGWEGKEFNQIAIQIERETEIDF